MVNHSVARALTESAKERILILDGAMGTMIQKHRLSEEEFRGEKFRDHGQDLKGNNDILVLTQPHIIREIHDNFLSVGADIICTNTFNGTSISQADYGLEGVIHELNLEAAKLARDSADAWTDKTPDKARYVAGALGPTNRTLSISPDVNDPGFRNIEFDALAASYKEQARALLEGGVDLILIETIFDTLNAKAAGFALSDLFEETGRQLPLMISGTITDYSGRNLSGQTPVGFWYSLRHLDPLTVGLNCSFGAKELRPAIQEIGAAAECLVCAYPNAGLPNELGEYDETPEETASHIGEWAESGLVNIVGGCCGTTPEHIAAMVAAVAGHEPRVAPELAPKMRLSGLEPFVYG